MLAPAVGSHPPGGRLLVAPGCWLPAADCLLTASCLLLRVAAAGCCWLLLAASQWLLTAAHKRPLLVLGCFLKAASCCQPLWAGCGLAAIRLTAAGRAAGECVGSFLLAGGRQPQAAGAWLPSATCWLLLSACCGRRLLAACCCCLLLLLARSWLAAAGWWCPAAAGICVRLLTLGCLHWPLVAGCWLAPPAASCAGGGSSKEQRKKQEEAKKQRGQEEDQKRKRKGRIAGRCRPLSPSVS